MKTHPKIPSLILPYPLASVAAAILLASLAADAAAARYDYTGYLGPATKRISSFCLANEVPAVGDFNGDGYDDVVTFLKNSNPTETGWVYVALNDKSGNFVGTARWNAFFSIDNEVPLTGDFNGDGKDDVITFLPGGGAFVAVSNGSAFVDSRNWYPAGVLMFAGETPLVGDFNGDGRDDVAVRAGTSVYVSLSTGSAFGAPAAWTSNFQTGVPKVGDVNGDGRDDLVGFVQATRSGSPAGDVEVALSNGSTAFTYGPPRHWHQNFAPDASYEPLLADLNGDGSMDILAVHTSGKVYAAISTSLDSFGSGAGGTDTSNPFWQWHRAIRNAGEIPLIGRFNGDANDDVAVFVRNLRAGTDSGAVFVSHCGGHAQPEPDSKLADFGYNTMGPGGTVPVTRPLMLLVSVCAGSPLPTGRTLAQYDSAVFGPGHPSVAGYFSEMSNGKFTFSRAGAKQVGPYACPIPGDSVRVQLEDAANQEGTGGFEFKNFDTNNDGTVSSNELVILGISTFEGGPGQTFGVSTTLFPGTARQVNIAVQWSYAGAAYSIDTWAHELCHAGCGMVDLYGSNCRSYGLTLASCSSTTTFFNHIDAWHKIRMGWVKPLIYDIRDFPAGAAILPTQAADERPVILYDSSRGTQDFHILEHRNGDYTAGTQTVSAAGGLWNTANRDGGYPKAGYDINVRSTSGVRKGFVTWSVKTDASHNVLDVRQRVSPGSNGVINSTRLGDDILWPSASAPTQIHCGPDGILQSVASGDDSYWQDGLCIAVPDPDNMLSREPAVLVPSGPAATTLHYYSNVAGAGDSGIMVRGEEVNGNNWQFLEWGKNFRPFIDTLAAPPTAAKPGDQFIALGSLGQRSRFNPKLVSASGQRLDLSVLSWTGAGATLKLPAGWIPPGRNRLMIFDGSTDEPSSNAWAVQVADPCATWVTDYFNLADLLAGRAQDNADPDADGQPNLIEMIMGTNPRQANAAPYSWVFDGSGLILTYNARLDRCAVKIVMESSLNLSTWSEEATQDLIPTPGATVTSGFLRSLPSATEKRIFRRLRITRL
jgi:M6 family metalloprotease-like protein